MTGGGPGQLSQLVTVTRCSQGLGLSSDAVAGSSLCTWGPALPTCSRVLKTELAPALPV